MEHYHASMPDLQLTRYSYTPYFFDFVLYKYDCFDFLFICEWIGRVYTLINSFKMAFNPYDSLKLEIMNLFFNSRHTLIVYVCHWIGLAHEHICWFMQTYVLNEICKLIKINYKNSYYHSNACFVFIIFKLND